LAGATTQTPLEELRALPRPLAGFGGHFAAGEGLAGEEAGKERNGREGKWRGGKERAPKLLLNQGPSEPCYATGNKIGMSQFILLKGLHFVTVINANTAFSLPE